MQKLFSSLLLSAVLLGPAAVWAQDDTVANEPDEQRTEAEVSEVTRGIYRSPFIMTANAGVLGFEDASHNGTSRGVTGITLNYHPSQVIGLGPIVLGFETGLLYSHLGGAGSNFLGRDSTQGVGLGANAFFVPLNIAAGFQINDKFGLTGHAGTDLIYRNIPGQMLIGRNDGVAGSSIDFLPAFGINLGYSVAKNMAFNLRGDLIPAPSRSIYTATLGASFPLA